MKLRRFGVCGKGSPGTAAATEGHDFGRKLDNYDAYGLVAWIWYRIQARRSDKGVTKVSATKVTNISGGLRKFVAMTLVATSIVSVAGTAWAMPFAAGGAIQNSAPSNVDQVRWGGRGWGWG